MMINTLHCLMIKMKTNSSITGKGLLMKLKVLLENIWQFISDNMYKQMEKLDSVYLSEFSLPTTTIADKEETKREITALKANEVEKVRPVKRVEVIEVLEVEEVQYEKSESWNEHESENLSNAGISKYNLQNKESQLPKAGSVEKQILQQLVSLSTEQFKQVTMALFQEMKEAKYNIKKCGPAGANGFSFYGSLEVATQLTYSINFVGEARQTAMNDAIDAKHVSRVLSMMHGGEYGFYITTSYFTESAQIEIKKENDSLKTINGLQLVDLFKELNLIQGDEINKIWLTKVLQSEQLCA
jgi:restriction endonuclease Mrr